MQVDVPSFSGSFGILPSHVASLAVLKPGVVTVYEDDGATKKFFVSSGSITINDDSSVQILVILPYAPNPTLNLSLGGKGEGGVII